MSFLNALKNDLIHLEKLWDIKFGFVKNNPLKNETKPSDEVKDSDNKES